MIKTFLKILLIILCMSFQIAFADAMKVNDITFDSSDSVIFIATSGSGGNVQIKKASLANPNRIFIDIQNAVLTKKQSSYDFTNGKLSNLKISQFSNNPPIVRVVMTYTAQLHPENVKIMSIGGNIIIKLQNYKPSQDYLTPIYREVKSSAYDYFEKVRISEADVITPLAPIALNPAVPQSVKTNSGAVVTIQPKPQNIVPQKEPVRINPPLQESKLSSRYFVSNAFVKQGTLLVSGTGIVNLEKVFYLSNPSRVVFDMPNTVCTASLRNKVFKLSETETVKIGQLQPTKIRIVVTTQEPQKYRAIYSNDLQNILIARDDKLQGVKLFNNTSNILVANTHTSKEYRNTINTLSLDFSEPIVHSLKRTNNNLQLKLYNISVESLSGLTQKLRAGNIKNIVVDRIGPIGIEILIPIEDESTVDCLENLTATKLVLTVKNPVVVQTTKPHIPKKLIVIDPGHGGTDPGATRNNVQEKTLTLEIAELVENMLKAQGATVVMTRSNDTFVSLSDRVVLSNGKEPDLFVSIHINACEREDVHGIETHYFKDDSLDLAKNVHKSMISKLGEINRGIFKSRFYVIRHTTAPSVLLELGFISNERERELLQNKSRQKKIAESITEGIIDYLNNAGKK